MVQRRNSTPASPRAAARLRRPVDQVLQPAFFKALSDPTRLKLLACLAKCGRACLVREVAECCEVDLSVVSRHLATLERAGILESSKDGRDVSYRVRFDEIVALFRNIANAMEQCCPARACCDTQGVCCG